MLAIVLAILFGGIIVWLVYAYAPIPQGFKVAIYIVVVVCLLFYVMNAMGVRFHDVPPPQVH